MFIAPAVLAVALIAPAAGGVIPTEWEIGGVKYLLLAMPDARVAWTRTRPQKDNREIMLVVPAAYTGKNGKTEGFVMDRGMLVSRRKSGYNGAAVVCGGSVKIIGTGNGSVLDDDFIKRHTEAKCSIFEQQLLVRDGKAQDYDRSSEQKFQRRALVRFSNGLAAIVQSGPGMTKTDFAEALTRMCFKNDVCVRDALYLDMGTYSEGWYRGTSGDINVLAKDKATSRQSNWIVFRYERG